MLTRETQRVLVINWVLVGEGYFWKSGLEIFLIFPRSRCVPADHSNFSKLERVKVILSSWLLSREDGGSHEVSMELKRPWRLPIGRRAVLPNGREAAGLLLRVSIVLPFAKSAPSTTGKREREKGLILFFRS